MNIEEAELVLLAIVDACLEKNGSVDERIIQGLKTNLPHINWDYVTSQLLKREERREG